MKKREQKGLSWWVGSLLILLVLAACGSEKSESQGQEETPIVDQNPAKPEPTAPPSEIKEPEAADVVVYYLGSDGSDESFINSLGRFINEKYPQFNLKWHNYNSIPLDTLIPNKERVDVFYGPMGNYSHLLRMGFTDYDMSELARKHQFDVATVEKTSVDIFTMMNNGILNALPYQSLHLALAYNKAIFDKFGVPYVTDGMTWDEVYDVAVALTRQDGDTQYLGFGLNQSPAFWRGNSYGQNMFDGETGLSIVSSGKWPDIFRNFTRFFQVPGSEYIGVPVAAFNNEQRVAMITALVSQVAGSTFTDIEELDVVQLPSFSDAMGVGSGTNPMFWSIPGTSEAKDAAFLAFTHILSPEVQEARARQLASFPVVQIPNLETALGSENERLQKMNVKGLIPQQFAPAILQSEFTGTVTSTLNQMFAKVVSGEKDINTALREAEETINQKIKETLAGR